MHNCPLALYGQHKRRARRRGIAFEFTFAKWVAWWEQKLGPDWMAKRGPRRDQYVMARYGDKGPYKPGNVKCVTASQNGSERRENGSAHHHKHTPETRQKMSEAAKRRPPQSLETRRKKSEAGKRRKHSLKTKRKMSAAQTRLWSNPIFRQKTIASMMGHEVSPETRRKIGEAVSKAAQAKSRNIGRAA